MKHVRPLLLWLLVPAAAAAQERDYGALQDSLARLDTPAAVGTLLAAPGRLPLERGLIHLRLHELTDDDDELDAARDAFEAANRSGGHAWAHYGIGVCHLRAGEIRIPSPGGVLNGVTIAQSFAEIVGLDHLSRARRAFRRALQLDSLHRPAALELAALALADRDEDALREARDAMDRIEQAGASREVLLARAELEAALGDTDAAAAAARRALDAAGPSDPLALHAQAAALLRVPGSEEAGAEAYFAGIDALTPEAAERYHADLLPILNEDDEDLRWRVGNLEVRKQWLREFWDMRAALAGVTVAERLASHYRRLATAQERYRRSGKRGPPPPQATVREAATERTFPFDDRGLVYVRHGPPDETVSTPGERVRQNETWAYDLPDGTRQLFHFVKLDAATDFRLVDDILHAVDGDATALNRGSLQPTELDAAIRLVGARARLDPRYQTLLAELEGARARFERLLATAPENEDRQNRLAESLGDAMAELFHTRQRLQAESRAQTLAAISTDSDRPRFGRDIPFYFDLYTFRGEEERTDLTVALVIPGERLRGRTSGDSTYYSLRIDLVVADTVRRRVTRRDTIYNYVSAAPLRRGEYLRTHLDLSAPPVENATYRLILRDTFDPDAGQLYGGRTTVDAFTGSGLQISDLVIAEPADSGAWQRGAVRLALLPPRELSGRPAFTLFYEVYNLAPGSAYSTEITVEPEGGVGLFGKLKRLLGAGASIRLQFSGVAPDAADATVGVQERRRIEADLGEGRYRIRVVITDLATGERATREELFLVSKGE